VAVLALAVAFMAAPGCMYARYRLEDALDCADVGITVSTKPCWGIYGMGVSVGGGGYSNVEGTLFGIGGGRIGAVPHYEKCWALGVFGHETHGWGNYDKDDPETLHQQYVGAIGLALIPIQSRPSYMPTCTHYLHLGYVGFVGNLRYTEVVDFMLGFTGFDLAGDDGQMARWPWKPGWRAFPLLHPGEGGEQETGFSEEELELPDDL